MSARKLALLLSGRSMGPSDVAAPSCDDRECINPAHAAVLPRGDHIKRLAALGECRTARKTAANRIEGAKRSRVPPDVWQWAYESSQSGGDVAHALGVAHTWVSQKRATRRQMFGGVA